MVDAVSLVALAATAAVAAGMDAIAGGGGLITLPALLVAGLDPVAALATNKLQSSFGAGSATYVFIRRGLLTWPLALAFVAAAGIGAIAGACCATLVPRSWLAACVPLVLLAVAGYFALVRRPAADDRAARVAPGTFAALGVTAAGFYDGIFGPGTGSFLTMGFVTLLGYGLLKATANAKIANASSNLGALAVFVVGGHVNWPVGLAMAGGAFAGGQVGSRLAIRHGAALIRPLLVTASCAMALKLLTDPTNPRHRAVASALAGGR